MGKLSVTAVTKQRHDQAGWATAMAFSGRPADAKSWVCRVHKNGNRRDFGQGLAIARPRTNARNPHMDGDGSRPGFRATQGAAYPTCKEAAAKVLAVQRKTWHNEKHVGATPIAVRVRRRTVTSSRTGPLY